ncbi:hypothetical protein OAJ94_03775 [Deltaproteobacteria bacterium]|nr:hypothetical protein [Deltaproteobacteria bacterium]
MAGLGTSEVGRRYQPATLSSAFGITFKMMFREEWRQNIDFAKKRHILMFPALLAIVTMVLIVGIRFLVGDGVADVEGLEDQRRAFTWDELKFALHLPLFMFSLGMGSFAFLGRVMVSQRGSGLNYLLASPALQPIPQSTNHFAYWVKEVCYYLMLILIPVSVGMSLGILLEVFFELETPLLWTSIPITMFAMGLTLSEGLAVSFLASALWTRGKSWSRIVPLLAVLAGVFVLGGWVDFDSFILGYSFQLNHSLWIGLLGILLIPALAWLGAVSVADDFEQQVSERKELLSPIYSRLSFLGNGTLRLLVAKEFVDLIRSGTIKKMIISYTVPLLVLLALAWLVDFTDSPIPVNLLTYAPFLGFFGFNFYSWLTGIDSPEFMNGIPATVPQLIRAKVVTYFLTTTWISILFLILMAWKLDSFAMLPVALIVMIANSIYIVCLTAFLMGLRPNKAIFDASIMIWFWVGTVIPLLVLFLLSFSQGDTSFYDNWVTQVGQNGLDAEAVAFDNERMQKGFTGILTISVLLIGGGWFLMKLLDRRWKHAPFNN